MRTVSDLVPGAPVAGTRDEGRRLFWSVWVTVFLSFLVVGTAWSLAQPPFSGVDEREHFNMGEAVWSRQFIPPLTPGGAQFESGIVDVRNPPDDANCFIARPTVAANCDQTTFHQPARRQPTLDYVSREPLLPAFLTGLPGYLAPHRVGLYLSRLLDTMIGAVGIATAVALALSRRRPFLLVGVVLAATPSVIAGLGVIGSSQLEIAAASVLWVAVALLLDGEAPTARFMTLVTAAAIVLLMSRPVSFIYLGLAILALVIAGGRDRIMSLARSGTVQISAACIAAATVFALAWYLLVSAPWNPQWVVLNHLPTSIGFSQRVTAPLRFVRGYWMQSIGAVGFNEYSGPWWMSLAWIVLSVTVVGAGMFFTRPKRQVAALALLVMVFLIMPVAVQAIIHPNFVPYWMGRYDIPTLAGILILGASLLDARFRQLSELRRLATTVLVAAPILVAVLFVGTLRRYTVGVHGTLNPFSWASGWHPPVPVIALIALGLVGLALAYGSIYRFARPLLRPIPSAGRTLREDGSGFAPVSEPMDDGMRESQRAPRPQPDGRY